MENLFPLKIKIPDSRYFIFHPENFICFILSSEAKEKEILIKKDNNIYFLGEIKKNEKTFNIYYIEIYERDSKTLNIKIRNDYFNIKTDEKIDGRKTFLFNKFLLDKEEKKITKLNFFDIYEEFEFYYRIHFEQKNRNSLESLISSAINIFKKDCEEANLSFLLTILIKDSFNIIDSKKFEKILLNIKYKGDLNKIKSKEIKSFCEKGKCKEIYLIYIILSEKNEEFKNLLLISKKMIFECFEKYNSLFKRFTQLFPIKNFLFEISDSFSDIKIIMASSDNLIDFIILLNEKKEMVSKYIVKENKDILYIDEFLKNISEEKFDDIFYIALNSLKEFETKEKTKLIAISEIEKFLMLIKMKKLSFRIFILLFIIHEEYTIKEFLLNIGYDIYEEYLCKNGSKINTTLNNYEILKLIELSLIYIIEKRRKLKIKIHEFLPSLISAIKFENINKITKALFSELKWEYIFKDIKLYEETIKNIKLSFKTLEDFEYIFIFIDKLIEKENSKINNNKEIVEKENKNIYQEEIIFTSELLFNKYLLFLKENNIKENDKLNNFFQITSKLIFLCYKYNNKENFINTLAELIKTELLNDIFISTLDKYELSDDNFNDLITILFKKRKFGRIYDLLMKEKYFSRLENLLNICIINDEIEQFFEKNNINYLILDIL